MRVAFVSGNRETLPDAAIPLGILSVMASVPERHERTLVDLCFEPDPFESLSASLREFRPDVVALGMRNIQNADYSGTSDQLDYYAKLIATIRAEHACPIAIGGSGFSVIPRELMRRLEPDYGISGEAEGTFPELLEALEKGSGFESVGNLHRFVDGALVSTPPPARFLDMNALPFADRHVLALRRKRRRTRRR